MLVNTTISKTVNPKKEPISHMAPGRAQCQPTIQSPEVPKAYCYMETERIICPFKRAIQEFRKIMSCFFLQLKKATFII